MLYEVITQRNDAQQRESAALAALEKAGMTVYKVDVTEREVFRQALPDWAELLPEDRITSYNVCYTKLLRIMENMSTWEMILLGAIALGVLIWAGPGVKVMLEQSRKAENRDRITSYNVCYTKLLRPDRG